MFSSDIDFKRLSRRKTMKMPELSKESYDNLRNTITLRA
jgi:hypothetical protein